MKIKSLVENIERQCLGLGDDAKNVHRYFINTFLKIQELSEATKTELQKADTISDGGINVLRRKVYTFFSHSITRIKNIKHKHKRELNDDFNHHHRLIISALDSNLNRCKESIPPDGTNSTYNAEDCDLMNFISKLKSVRDNIAAIQFDDPHLDNRMINILDDFHYSIMMTLRILLRTLIKYEANNGYDSDQRDRRLIVEGGPEFVFIDHRGYTARVPIQHYQKHIAPFIRLNNILVMHKNGMTGCCFMPDSFLKLKLKLIAFRGINFNPPTNHTKEIVPYERTIKN